MSAAAADDAPAADAAAFLQQLSVHALLLRALVAIVEHGIVERLGHGPQSAAELAASGGLDELTLYRLLRFLASFGFFREGDDGRFHRTPRADALCAGAPGSIRDRLERPWQDLLWRSYERLPDMLRTGQPAFEQVHDRPFFEYLAAQPGLNAIFDRSMARVSRAENPVIAASYPFGRACRVVDVGGGHGGLLAAILDRYPEVRGVLFDQPQVVAAPNALTDARYAGRWERVAGDFFQALPRGGDVYVLKRILHDWDDSHATLILETCRDALRHGARLLVVDAVIEPGNAPDPNKFMDVNIMALMAGRERTAAEFHRLCAGAGLRLLQVMPLPAPATLSIMEAALP